MDKFTIYLDVVVWAGLCTEVCADLPVDSDATRRDQLITMPPRTDAGGREKAIEAHLC